MDVKFTRREPKGFVNRADKLYPQLYRAVQHLLRDDFFALNIGANDGVDNDPIHPFLLMYPQWRGLFVEPVAYNFEQLQHNYQRFAGATLLRAAISAKPMPLYYVTEESGCNMSWVSQICSFDQAYVRRSLEGLRKMAPAGTVSDDAEQYIVRDDDIPCISLAALLQEQAVTRVDFLNIDAEGADYEIFSAYDFERLAPAILCVETALFTDSERSHFEAVMAQFNYRFVCVFELFSDIYIKAG